MKGNGNTVCRHCAHRLLRQDAHRNQSLMPSPPITAKLKRQRRREPAIPKEIREEVTTLAHGMARKYRSQFTPELKGKVLRLVRALLPPKPRRRGRPRDRTITSAMMLLGRFRRKYPQERPRDIWNRVCLELIPGYAALPEVDQRAAREDWQPRVKSRLNLIRSRTKREPKIRPKFPPSRQLHSVAHSPGEATHARTTPVA
jgi:hypothetical protein